MDIMFPKQGRKKKRKRHRASILHAKDGMCYLCMRLNQDCRTNKTLHEHHVYGGANRAISEAEGFKVYLCLAHHIDGPEAVHNNQKNMRLIQEDCQKAYEKTHTRQQFMELVGRNYLEGDGESYGH